jgi:hypothetical protein
MTTRAFEAPPLTQGSRPRPKLTGVITSFNEEHNIAECIESMNWCDEIVLVDSFSTDRTPEIARSYDKVRFFQRPYFGAGAQKNWALQHVQHDWVFLLDADERCTPTLKNEIESLRARGPEHDAYTINRNVFFLGKRIRFSGWQHDRVARLFRRGTAYYENRRVHCCCHSGRRRSSSPLTTTWWIAASTVRVPPRPLRLLGSRAVPATAFAAGAGCSCPLWRFIRPTFSSSALSTAPADSCSACYRPTAPI